MMAKTIQSERRPQAGTIPGACCYTLTMLPTPFSWRNRGTVKESKGVRRGIQDVACSPLPELEAKENNKNHEKIASEPLPGISSGWASRQTCHPSSSWHRDLCLPGAPLQNMRASLGRPSCMARENKARSTWCLLRRFSCPFRLPLPRGSACFPSCQLSSVICSRNKTNKKIRPLPLLLCERAHSGQG